MANRLSVAFKVHILSFDAATVPHIYICANIFVWKCLPLSMEWNATETHLNTAQKLLISICANSTVSACLFECMIIEI